MSTHFPAARAAALLALFAAACAPEKKQAGPPPPAAVQVAKVTRQDLALFVESVGVLDGYVNADIRARVKGYLEAQRYKDGAAVKQGQPLFQIERTEYLTGVASAKAALARARANQQRAKADLERATSLAPQGVVSKQELDNATAASSDVAGQIDAAAALLHQAEVNLSYTTLRSPIDGVAGVALVRTGNLVGQEGPTLLATVSQLDPIRVNFPVSEVDYVRTASHYKHLDSRDLAWAKKQFALLSAGKPTADGEPGIELILSDGTVYGGRGVVVSVNRQVDPSTGTIQFQALFPNPQGSLRPGQYGRVRLRREDEGRAVLAVPEKALISVQGTYSIGVVGDGNKVQLRRVEIGPHADGLRVVEKGLKEGESIVVEGVQKITDGAVVDARPAPAAAPSPGEQQKPTAIKN